MTNIDKWRQLIADRETSGLTVKEWCVRNSISKDSYYYWFKKVRNADSGKADGQILFAEIQKETPVSSHPLIHGNLRVSWNGCLRFYRNSGKIGGQNQKKRWCGI